MDVMRDADIIPRAEMRSLIEHLKSRARSFSILFVVALIIGYPLAERMIAWAASNADWRPDGVGIVIIQPLELILLKLRISVHVALGSTMLALIFDLAWNGREIIARGKRTAPKEGSVLRLHHHPPRTGKGIGKTTREVLVFKSVPTKSEICRTARNPAT